MKKFEEADQIHRNCIEQEILTVNKAILELEKKADKNVKKLTESQ